MTLIILAKAKEGFVVASDSALTMSKGAYFQKFARKIHYLGNPLKSITIEDKGKKQRPIDFECIVAGAGTLPSIQKFILEFRTYLSQIPQNEELLHNLSPALIATLAKDAMVNLLAYYNYRVPQIFLGEYWKEDHGIPNGFFAEIGVVFRFEGEIYAVKLMPNPELFSIVDNYETLGSGSPYAEFLMIDLYEEGLTIDQVALLSAYVITRVSAVEPGVKLPYQIFYIEKGINGNVGSYIREEAKIFDENIKKILAAYETFSSNLRSAIKNISVRGVRENEAH